LHRYPWEAGDTIIPGTDFDFSVLQTKLVAVDPRGHGLKDLYRYVYEVLCGVSEQREALVMWDEMVLGIRSENLNTPYVHTGETREVAYMRTLCVDYMPDGLESTLDSFRKWKEERWAPALLRKRKMNKISPALHQGLNMLSTFLLKNESRPFAGMFEEAMRRRLCWTKAAYLGLVPPDAKTDDEIWLLKGCRVPVVLRRVGDGEDRELVGDSYIHGVMYGEAFEEEKCEKVTIV